MAAAFAAAASRGITPAAARPKAPAPAMKPRRLVDSITPSSRTVPLSGCDMGHPPLLVLVVALPPGHHVSTSEGVATSSQLGTGEFGSGTPPRSGNGAADGPSTAGIWASSRSG